MDKADQRRQLEMKVVDKMITLYCQKNHHGGATCCAECQQLLDYALQKLEVCPNMGEKTFCSSCTIHCYQPEMRQAIGKVMAFSGPRMLIYHPIMAVRHLMETGGLGKVKKK